MWFVNANVIDVLTGERLRGLTVETAPDGTIAQVAAAPPGLTGPTGAAAGGVVDVAGRWLLPGLISCHTHLSIVFGETDEAENPALTAYRAATRATEALQAGVTTVRCVHEQNRADLLLRIAVRRGWYQAPRIFGAGRAVSTPGGHGAGGGCAYAAGLLGIGDHVGQVRPGYVADFVAVASDPLDDLASMRTISLVVQGGRVVREDAA